MKPLARIAVLGFLIALAACTTPLPDPTLDPAGPLSVRVGGSVIFDASPMPDGVDWSVAGIDGGDDVVGVITAGGVYTAPARVPAPEVVDVTATDAVRPTRSASAEVTITAPGTMYVYDEVVYVYGNMDTTDGNATPDRSFVLDGQSDVVFEMALAPSLDTAFLAFQSNSPMLYRVPSISTADGTVTDFTTFDDGGYQNPSGLAYDAVRDILYARYVGALLIYDGAATAPDGKAADRELSGPAVAAYVGDVDVRLTLDPQSDRLFVSRPDGAVGVYDAASTIDGDQLPDREFTVDVAALTYLWGMAYDAGRDELYLGDQLFGAGVYVIANASTAEGSVVPSRVIGGVTNPLAEPSMLSYDAKNDRLAVVLTNVSGAFSGGVAVFDAASTVDGDVPPTRLIAGSELPVDYPYGGYLDPTQ